MIVVSKNNEQIVIKFSGKVGKEGLKRIREYIEFLETASETKRKRVPQSVIDKLAEDINEAAWKKIKKARGL